MTCRPTSRPTSSGSPTGRSSSRPGCSTPVSAPPSTSASRCPASAARRRSRPCGRSPAGCASTWPSSASSRRSPRSPPTWTPPAGPPWTAASGWSSCSSRASTRPTRWSARSSPSGWAPPASWTRCRCRRSAASSASSSTSSPATTTACTTRSARRSSSGTTPCPAWRRRSTTSSGSSRRPRARACGSTSPRPRPWTRPSAARRPSRSSGATDMAGSLRALRRRIRSTQSTKKIFSAQELIAGARIVRAQARVEASKPYSREITRVLSALASSASLDHPLLTERQNPGRAAVLVITSDRGFAGSYNVNVLRRTEELLALLRQEGKEPLLYVVGRKGETYYSFRNRDMVQTFTGFSEQPRYENAQEVGQVLIDAFTAGEDDDDETGGAGADNILGVDELHIVYTEFRSLLAQVPVAKRMAPLEVEEVEEFDYEREDRTDDAA